MTSTANVKHRFVCRVLKSALAAALATSLLSCGGGGGGSNVVADAGSTPSSSAPTSTSVPPAPASTNTPVALAKFWDTYGAKESFPQNYVELVTRLLEAEDKVVAKDFQGARVIIEDLIKKNPLMDDNTVPGDNIWDINYNKMQLKNPRPHLGEPGPYAYLRMLDEITRVGVSGKSMLGKTSIQMAIVMPVCTDITPQEGPTLLNHPLNPEIEADDYKVVRQSLRLFQSYLLAISGGELSLKLNFYKINKCIQINKETEWLGRGFNAPLLQLPKDVTEKTDMFWLIYPNDIDKGAKINYKSGLSWFGDKRKPVFMCEDDWIIKKRAPDQGVGPRTEVERRIYLSEWFQHEFFHHLYSSYRELKLEGDANHEWFDRNYWQKDFVGKIEEDYYSESLRKRFYNQPISIAQKLQLADK